MSFVACWVHGWNGLQQHVADAVTLVTTTDGAFLILRGKVLCMQPKNQECYPGCASSLPGCKSFNHYGGE
jgi:hypothetical protein